MSSLRQSPLPTLQALSASFTELSTILQPLLAHNYEAINTALQANSSASASTQPDAAEKGEDELHGRLDAARMQVSVAYVLMDLVWILLKTKGVDPTNHPVMQELERVKSYFGKIKRVQDDEKEPKNEQKGSRVDKSAAGRFIRAALAGEPGSTPGKHTKFDDDASPAKPEKKQETKEAETGSAAEEVKTTPAGKKKRPAMDPFEGYDKPKTPKSATKDTDSASSSPAKKKKKKSAK
ncbi:related to LRP1 - nuclear exosome-associated nucleic acid binding protein [Moesziomyces antarcticus]|uniref:Exosome complex protein n=1 Tax=Pseudozyma antarctica TaxID=84753 RepID=A0A5C3FEB2_PSEA2|nr:related to LRP1 - nuclear exosome-associated nucleic acid binding protein [Moesziomyces antarcticus]